MVPISLASNIILLRNDTESGSLVGGNDSEHNTLIKENETESNTWQPESLCVIMRVTFVINVISASVYLPTLSLFR